MKWFGVWIFGSFGLWVVTLTASFSSLGQWQEVVAPTAPNNHYYGMDPHRANQMDGADRWMKREARRAASSIYYLWLWCARANLLDHTTFRWSLFEIFVVTVVIDKLIVSNCIERGPWPSSDSCTDRFDSACNDDSNGRLIVRYDKVLLFEKLDWDCRLSIWSSALGL